MKYLEKTLVGAAVTAAMLNSGAALAGASANVGITSNYLWRGMTQTDDAPAISAGLDYEHDAGFYVGTWASNVDFPGSYDGLELDLYAGYAGKAGDVEYDIGYVMYNYPSDSAVQADFSEIILSGTMGPATLTVGYTVDKEWTSTDVNDLYLSLGAEFEVMKDFAIAGIKSDVTLGVLYGNYDFQDSSATDVSHIQASLSWDDFVVAVDKNDITGDDDVKFSVAYSKSFDF